MILSSQKISVLETIVGLFNAQTWTPWFLHVSPILSDCPWDSPLHYKSSAVADPLILPASHPTWQKVRRDTWEKCRSSTTHRSCTGCRSTGMGGSVSSGMIPSFVRCSFSFLMCSTLVPSCSGSCMMSFSRKVSHIVLASVLMAVFLGTKLFCLLLLAIWQSTASGFSSLSYEQFFSCYSKYWFGFKGFCYHTSS